MKVYIQDSAPVSPGIQSLLTAARLGSSAALLVCLLGCSSADSEGPATTLEAGFGGAAVGQGGHSNVDGSGGSGEADAGDGGDNGGTGGGESEGAELPVWSAVLKENFRYEATGIAGLTQHEVLALAPIDLNIGDQGLLEAQAHVTGPAGLDQPILVAPRISCRLKGTEFTLGAWTWGNWEGADRQADGVEVRVRDVFTAPETGTFICSLELLSGAGVGVPPNTFMTATSGSEHTWLTFTGHPSSEKQRWVEGAHVDIDTGDSAEVLKRTYELPANATHFTVLSDVQMSSCPPAAVRRGWCTIEGSTDVSKIESRLHVVQLAKDGESACSSFTFPDEQPARLSIPNALHHAKAFHELSFEVDSTCGRKVQSWVALKVISGNPVRVEHRLATGPLTVGGLLANN